MISCRVSKWVFFASLVVSALTGFGYPAASVQLDKPLAVSFHKSDDTAVAGRLTAYDADGFDLINGSKQSLRISWQDLDAHNQFIVRAVLISPKDADAWIDLGRDLLAVPDGQDWSKRAFDRALKIDPKRGAEVEAARHDATARSATPKGTADGVMPANNPSIVGTSQNANWGPLSDADRASVVTELKTFADQGAKTLKHELRLEETKYFLFYSDLNPNEAMKWGGLLDRMYARLAELFAVAKGQNLWRGKALIFVFADKADYRRFETQVQQTDPGESAGMTHCYGDGLVHIAFYRQPDELNFAHVLVHESVHGFLHRYRSPSLIPSWINEGLAETIASELVPNPRISQFTNGLAKGGLKSHSGQLKSFFELEHIEGWQYPVAETLTVYMIRQSKKNYVDFINGIKDGLTWRESLEKKYKVSLDRLVAGYGQAMGEKLSDQ